MKRAAVSLLIILTLLACSQRNGETLLEPQAILPTFPGAEGGGALSKGGRGGRVIYVTNLNDSGAGSLRAALEASGPRIVVFRVGGYIKLVEPIVVWNPNVMVAGQSAPGDGIVIRNWPIAIRTSEVVLRHLRFRIDGFIERGEEQGYGIEIVPFGDEYVSNIIVDHCSISWGSDDQLVIGGPVRNVTVQWSLIGEGLHTSQECPECGRATWIGPQAKNISLHHNLYIHNGIRHPMIVGGATVDVVNNVFYNWAYSATQLQAPNWVDPDAGINRNLAAYVNFVGNYYKGGQNSVQDEIWFSSSGSPERYLSTTSKVYVKDNIGTRSRPTGNENEWDITTRAGTGDNAPTVYQSQTRINLPRVNTQDAITAYARVLNNAGARLPRLDSIDRRLIADARSGTGELLLPDISPVGGWPVYKNGTPPVDTDKDGMPNTWETQYGFNPNSANDNKGDADGDGYTNIEEFLNRTVPR